ncbi:MAG: hypothetical protein K0R93_36 [Anaerosolibacter sp.]|jgi:outer membrane protein assembly factor BamB|uniref:outer membrane protein assembly factor BamB family protein n=1 Tax=Anaerosolibacter sp. TaxID=1872527 RepID=UPI002627E236|nr:PQQ-binding-like beta-propeller repeat protein [Anaerosolibacter sp.]MDF2545138.1 hypothetical protein [Anaerosolibacter sp.]
MKKYVMPALLIVAALGFGLYVRIYADKTIVSVAMYQGNNQHTGVYETEGVKNFQKLKWKYKTGGSINSAPIVDEDKVYIGSDDDRLYALNIETGKEFWSFKTNGDIRSTPCIYGKMLFFSSEDGNMYALNKETGKKMWHAASGKRITKNQLNDVVIGASPAAENDTVFFGSYDGHMYALDIKTGALKWKFKTEASVRSSPALYKGKVYFGSFDGHMYCVDAKAGNLEWKYQIPPHPNSPVWEIQSSPMIYDDIVYFGGIDHTIYALDSRTGKERWAKYFADQPIYSTIAYKEGILFHGTIGWHNPRVCAVDLDGNIKWKFQNRDRTIRDSAGNLYIGSWIHNQQRFFPSPVIAGDLLYIGCWDKNLYALDIHTGEMKWKFTAEGPIGSSAAVRDGIVYVGSYDGHLYALSD